MENPTLFTNKLLKLVREFRKVSRYKINVRSKLYFYSLVTAKKYNFKDTTYNSMNKSQISRSKSNKTCESPF